jgi:hypothetical protein
MLGSQKSILMKLSMEIPAYYQGDAKTILIPALALPTVSLLLLV